MNLSIGQDEMDKENDYYSRVASPIDDPELWAARLVFFYLFIFFVVDFSKYQLSNNSIYFEEHRQSMKNVDLQSALWNATRTSFLNQCRLPCTIASTGGDMKKFVIRNTSYGGGFSFFNRFCRFSLFFHPIFVELSQFFYSYCGLFAIFSPILLIFQHHIF